MQCEVETAAATHSLSVLHWPQQGNPAQAATRLLPDQQPQDQPAPDQPAVVFLHGFLGQAEDWRPIAAGLRLQADCYAVDLPGHGASSAQASSGAVGMPLCLSWEGGISVLTSGKRPFEHQGFRDYHSSGLMV